MVSIPIEHKNPLIEIQNLSILSSLNRNVKNVPLTSPRAVPSHLLSPNKINGNFKYVFTIIWELFLLFNDEEENSLNVKFLCDSRGNWTTAITVYIPTHNIYLHSGCLWRLFLPFFLALCAGSSVIILKGFSGLGKESNFKFFIFFHNFPNREFIFFSFPRLNIFFHPLYYSWLSSFLKPISKWEHAAKKEEK